MSKDIFLSAEDLSSNNWNIIFKKFDYNGNRLSKFLKKIRARLRIKNGGELDCFLISCSLEMKKVNVKRVIFRQNDTLELE